MNIMKKISLALALCCASFYSMADQLPLGGFSYGPVEAPTGKEWESPENLALNKEQPHAYIFPFQDVESARKVLPENSKFYIISWGVAIRSVGLPSARSHPNVSQGLLRVQ